MYCSPICERHSQKGETRPLKCLVDIDGQKTKFGWTALFQRKKAIIRSRLVVMGHKAALVDSVGLCDDIDIAPAAGPSRPTFRPSSDPPTGISPPRPTRLPVDGRLNDLIGWLHEWLYAGPTGVRSDFMRNLGTKVRPILSPDIHIEADGSRDRTTIGLSCTTESLDLYGLLYLLWVTKRAN